MAGCEVAPQNQWIGAKQAILRHQTIRIWPGQIFRQSASKTSSLSSNWKQLWAMWTSPDAKTLIKYSNSLPKLRSKSKKNFRGRRLCTWKRTSTRPWASNFKSKLFTRRNAKHSSLLISHSLLRQSIALPIRSHTCKDVTTNLKLEIFTLIKK